MHPTPLLLAITAALTLTAVLLAEPPASKITVKRTSLVQLEGVEPLRWKDAHNTVIGSMAIAARALGEDITYAELMGHSGAAFRIQFKWCPSSPHANCGFKCSERVLSVYPFEVTPLKGDEKDPAVRQAIVDSIDRGVPVLMGSEEAGLVLGYEDAGKRLLADTYVPRHDNPRIEPLKNFPWGFGLLKHKETVPDRKAAVMASIKLAVELWDTKEFDKYPSGKAAYELWIKDLQQGGDRFDPQSKDYSESMIGNAWTMECLVDARKQAVLYLRKVASDLTPEAAVQLQKAAQHYSEIPPLIEAACENAPYPWTLGKRTWSADMRKKQAAALSEALDLETQAIDELRLAIK